LTFIRRQCGGSCLEHIRTRHYAPESDGVVEHFHRSLKHEHLYQRETASDAELAQEVKASLATFTEVRPHETLAQRTPLTLQRADPHLCRALSLQDP